MSTRLQYVLLLSGSLIVLLAAFALATTQLPALRAWASAGFPL